MSILRTIKCNVEGCGANAIEPSPGAGWRGWGIVQGKRDGETGEMDFHLCPLHLEKVFGYLRSLDNGMD